MTHPRHTLTALVLIAVPVFAASSCAPGSDDAGPKPDSGPSVIAPGKPGEDAAVLSADEAAAALPDDRPNQADIGYVTMMIEHHEQALVMTALAAEHAKSEKVDGLAERIAASQGPEIQMMKGWLSTDGGGAADEHRHSHADMPGMATGKQLAALRAARGTEFDELFLRLMITHHQGALTMAADVLSDGNNVRAEEMANDVVATQTSEISRMRGLL